MSITVKVPAVVDFTKATAIVKEIFEDDRWVKDAFSAHCSVEIIEFSEVLAECFKKYGELEKLTALNEQCIYTVAFIHGVLDDVITSAKLISSGKLIASGNLMRQAIEGLALATLCSYKGLLLIPRDTKKKTTTPINYWVHVKNGDRKVHANHALRHVELNNGALGVRAAILEEMKRAQKMYHSFSHPSILSLISRVAEDDGKYLHFIGGSFDTDKIDMYKTEIRRKTGFCLILPSAMDLLAKHLK